MNDSDLKNLCMEQLKEKGFITFPEDVFNSLSAAQAEMLSHEFAANSLMQLPSYEMDFFKWLKEEDRPVWDDLWEHPGEEPYLVGLSFLPMLIEKDGRGFPICDLLKNDNYYFSLSHMVDAESQIMIDTSRKRFKARKSMTAAQLLVLEISVGPIDIWHFAYKHKINLDDAREAVRILVEDQAIVHLTAAEHIAHFIEF